MPRDAVASTPFAPDLAYVRAELPKVDARFAYIQAESFAFDPIAVEASADGAKKPRTFKMVGYSGGFMDLGWGAPVVCDIEGGKVAAESIPILIQHGRLGYDQSPLDAVLGHTTKLTLKNRVTAEGVISGVSEDVQKVVELAANGFPFQASIGFAVRRYRFVAEKEKASVNGRTLQGPFYLVEEWRLVEISFVITGADGATSSRIAAQLAAQEGSMSQFSSGGSLAAAVAAANAPATPTVALPTSGEVSASAANGTLTAAAAAAPPPAAPAPALALAGTQGIDVAAITAAASKAATEAVFATVQRMHEIDRITSDFPEIRAAAAKDNWSIDRVRAEVAEVKLKNLREGRPSPGMPAVIIANAGGLDRNVFECALCVAGGLPNIEAKFDAKVLEASHKRFRNGMGLQEIFLEAAWANGYSGRRFNGNEAEVMRAAWSYADIGGILANVANKFLLDGYMGVEQTWREIATIGITKDFKTQTHYRMTDNMVFEEVGPTGELKHGELGQQTFTNRVRPFGKMLTLTREDLINDDLGALTAVPQRLGRGGGLAFNLYFWKKWLAEAGGTFFTVGNKNYFSGATSVLSIDSLTTMEKMFLEQTDPAGHPLGIPMALLLVPPALKAPADVMLVSGEVRDNTANTKTPTKNPHMGKWKPVCSAYLNNALVAGGSATAFYGVASPKDLATVEVLFLNGVQNPVIESADADFNVLGVQFRGIFDFGVELQDPRGAVKSKGAA